MKRMRKKGLLPRASWTFYFLTYLTCLIDTSVTAVDTCPFPSVPYAASYINVTGGPDQTTWKIKYDCDSGYELFGEDVRECQAGEWRGDQPFCAVNVARHKPSESSSQVGSATPGNAVDGRTSTVHEGKHCTETKAEKSPWWRVDLLRPYPVKHVRLTTRCCDDVPIKKAEIRVGNSSEHTNNPLCNWIPRALDEGATETIECVEDLIGRFVSISMTGVEAVLSLCEVEVFSTGEIGLSSCSKTAPPDQLAVFQDVCYQFLPEEESGYEEANAKCGEAGYHLVDNLNTQNTEYLTSRLDREKESRGAGSMMAWVGALREDGDWEWASGGRVNDIEWGRGQPNNYNQEQNCAVLDSELDWKWNDISCRISAFAVCSGRPSRCPSPPVSEGSYASSGSWEVGTYVHYHCPVGEMPIGAVNQTCNSNGRWSGSTIRCKKVDCGRPPGLENGEVHLTDGRTTWGAHVLYKCKDDYSLMNGDAERKCEEFGWTGKVPKCEYTKCPEPKFVENAEVTEVGEKRNSLGAKLVYKCKEGHKASGSLSRECLIGGKWSGTEPKCEFVDCSDPPEVANGRIELLDGRTTFGAEAEYSCSADYLLQGQRTRRCEANGKWTRNEIECEIIRCPSPKAPSGGQVSGFNREVHSVIEFSCLQGHVLDGKSTLTCTRDGLWSDRAPSCRFVDCGAVPRIRGGTVHYVNASTHLGSVVRYGCDKTHNIAGDEERKCLESGQWSGTTPDCSEIRCALPERPNNTVVSVSSTERLHGTSVIRSKVSMAVTYRVGSTLKYRCERGHVLETEDGDQARVHTRRCTTSGTWTGGAPTCKYVDCGKPDPVENADFSLQNDATTFGSMVFYKCHDHFNLQGFEKRRCSTSGQWEPEAPNCTETLCKPLAQPENGKMVLTTLRIGGLATFQCDHGFGLKGDPDIECLSSGSWSSWPPNCVEIDCGQPLDVENGRIFLANDSTKIGSTVEYHCFPGYDRSGPFERKCGLDGYWSGPEPRCQRPTPPPRISILNDNTVDGTKNVRAGNRSGDDDDSPAGVGVYIGVALGVIVIVGLIVLGGYFYRKQRALATKPAAPYRDRNANGLSGYTNTTMYGGTAPTRPPPPPIQMYSIDDGASEDHRGPIYDTINDDSSAGSGGGYSGSNGSNGFTAASTFSPPPPVPNYNGGYPPPPPSANGYHQHDYDVPEGSERPGQAVITRQPSVGTVTINGIAV